MPADNDPTNVGNPEESTYDRLKRTLKTVEIDNEKFYVAEGDLLIDENELSEYAKIREKAAPAAAADRDRLIVVADNGKPVRWKPGMILSYCVLKNTFSDPNNYETVKNNMKQATWDWEATCGVKFEYKPEFDDSESNATPAGVLFTVREIDAGGRFIASAFFPNSPAYKRRLVIDPSYYSTSFDGVGVLRHELGHVIGWRHEQINSGAPPACQGEDVGEVIELTDYDPQSVMHYFCGGVGTLELAITDKDRDGSQKLYGPPLDAVTFVE